MSFDSSIQNNYDETDYLIVPEDGKLDKAADRRYSHGFNFKVGKKTIFCCAGPKIQPKAPWICRCCPFDVYPLVMLLCICFLTFGSYWVFDTPGAIQTQLTNWFQSDGKSYTNLDNLLLYSVYSIPNIFLAFFGGYIIDRITGVRIGGLVFCGLVMLGELIFCFGITLRVYPLALLGRFVFGLGGETLTVCQNTYTARWFEGETLALAFGLVVSFSRIGSSVNFLVTPYLASNVPVAVWVGCCMTFVSFAFCLIAGGLDWYGEKKGRIVKVEGEEPPKLTHVRYFPASAWILFFICFFFYIAVLTFYTVASQIMQFSGNKLYGAEVASMFIAIPNFVSIFASPFFGYLVDKLGRALWWLASASILLMLAHVLFLCNANSWTTISPVILMIWLGFAYAMGAASLWPILSHIIPKKMLGTAYGTMTSVQNLGLALAPQLLGFIQDSYTDPYNPLRYTMPIFFFVFCALISFILCCVLMYVDLKVTAGRLNCLPGEKKLWEELPNFGEHATETDDLADQGVPIEVDTQASESPYSAVGDEEETVFVNVDINREKSLS
eukprot:CAMPEP_0174239346 /NCGR_PEP_ID=MMETSP0417-20130205/14247_1 /TAXON_ID=242541 /ORGANISM="Mayorella sp, Strain BSH-02190019" /LENGTH=553 /DNA_ID=CAMNT_0015318283 /DNA_START=139 /DNA_END=1797 /DNA_ORIENTATION=-